MHRRLLGGIVFLVVLAAAIVAPNVSQRRVAGSAVPITVPGPPSRGDCVTSLADVNGELQGGGFGVGDEIEVPAPGLGPCAGPIVGEVVSVQPNAGVPQRLPAPRYQELMSECGLSSIYYTGTVPPVVDGSSGAAAIVWAPAINFQFTYVGPSRLQRLVGQQWSACVIGAPFARPYEGRLRDVLSRATLPSVFAHCWRTAAMLDSEQVDCDEPHAVELLATTGLGSTPLTATEVHRSCTVFAGRMMRTDDPTRGGALSYSILDFRDTEVAVPPSAEPLSDTYITCIATTRGGLRLTGSLVGVGNGPLPTG
jgi:hypothetical protein